jgi:hypothetical protein
MFSLSAICNAQNGFETNLKQMIITAVTTIEADGITD